ncbi:GNAT family N-acetyltransferase [Solwaraspora sp. WMMB335]|uniref:GNAT family N-acetyltransferase n=1 Tax=Solwaraspora sp. WMMB335 TaxID=3404118 RepID=UPI003B935835
MTATTSTTMVRRARPDDIPHLARVLVAAFVDTPDMAWLVPDRRDRRRILSLLAPGMVAHAMTAGSAYTTVDRAAAALWLPYGVAYTTPAHHARRLERIAGPYADRFAHLAALLRTHAPRRPHTYLAHLGVHPARHRQGLGTALLAHRHVLCDTATTPAHLIATTPAARNLYHRLGYQPTTAHPLALPDNGPPLWPMWREPGAGTSRSAGPNDTSD